MREMEEKRGIGAGREPLYRQIQRFIRTAKCRELPQLTTVARSPKSPVHPVSEFYLSPPAFPTCTITQHYFPRKQPAKKQGNSSLSPLKVQPTGFVLQRRSSWLAVRRRSAVRVQLKLPRPAQSPLRPGEYD